MRANDDTLALICNSLVSILGVRVDALAGCLSDVFKFMLQMSEHRNAFVATQATGLKSRLSLSRRVLERVRHAGCRRDASGSVESVPAAVDSFVVEGLLMIVALPTEHAVQ